LGVLGDPEVEIDEIATIIEQDPALVARILGLANSAFFGQAKAITEVRQAIIRVLGLNLVKSLALSISLAGVFDTKACRAFKVADYWYAALGSAALTRMIVHHSPVLENGAADQAYLTALLHNLGMLLLASISPDEFSQALELYHQDPSQSLLMTERDCLGIDHFAAGEWLLRRWHLPEVVVDVIGHLGDVVYQGPHLGEWSSVRTAVDFVAAELAGESGTFPANSSIARVLELDESRCEEITKRYSEQIEALQTVAHALD
jgi:HD-like signal output (HDOD) protein